MDYEQVPHYDGPSPPLITPVEELGEFDFSQPGNSNTASGMGTPRRKDQKRVGFSEGNISDSSSNPSRNQSGPSTTTTGAAGPSTPTSAASAKFPSRSPMSSAPNSPITPYSHEALSAEVHKAFGQPYVPKPVPVMRRGTRAIPTTFPDNQDYEETNEEKRRSGREAQERAQKLAKAVYSYSAPGSRRNSNDMSAGAKRNPYEDSSQPSSPYVNIPLLQVQSMGPNREPVAEDLTHSPRPDSLYVDDAHFHSNLRSGQVTPHEDPYHDAEVYVAPPKRYRGGILSSMLQLQNHQGQGHTKHEPHSYNFSAASTAANTPQPSPPTSGASTPVMPPKPWGTKHKGDSGSSISRLIQTSSMVSLAGQSNLSGTVAEELNKSRPGMGKRTRSKDTIQSALKKFRKPEKDEVLIKKHIAATLVRQRYLEQLCKALMQYGAPTHRLEEYLKMSARVLQIEGQFLYIPGCMIISFDDSQTHTAEVRLVRTPQGIDLGKLRDVHEIYKEVVHDYIGAEVAIERLDRLMKKSPKYNPWILVPMYGLASASVGPFAFQARLIDLPVCFLLGSILGFLQLIAAQRSALYSNIFEISASVITSFLARAFGSINNGNTFCFSALAQSSIALILPGYMVLCSSLELQSRHIVAGSVRMVYAIIYSLFLGFGITIGTVIYGTIDHNATSATTCQNQLNEYWSFLFVPLFTICLLVINQAKWRQAPLMVLISFAGFAVNFFSSRRFKGNTQISNTLGALTIGVLANLNARVGPYISNFFLDKWELHIKPRLPPFLTHRPGRRLRRNSNAGKPEAADIEAPIGKATSHDSSTASDATTARRRRIGYGIAATSMIPAIFVQVPSGLAVNGSLVSGITSADQIIRNSTDGIGVTVVSNAHDSNMSAVNSVAFNVGFSVVQVAIGITVGLFLAALLVWPVNKRRSALFSF